MGSTAQRIAAQAAVLRELGGHFNLETVHIDAPRAGEVLVRMAGTGICHSDLIMRAGFPMPLPIVLGHEGAGVVEAVGTGVNRVKPGDHVVLSFNSCQQCPSCLKSQPAYCHHMTAYNVSGLRPDGSSALSQDGAKIHANFFGQSSFATHAIAYEVNTVPVPKNLPLEILGPLGCGVQTGAGAAINALRLQPGDSLAIFGGGGVGLSALLGALAVGAGPFIVVEPNAARAALARELGAAHTIDPAKSPDVLAEIKALSGGGVTHAIDTTAIPEVVATAAESLLHNGMLGLLGFPRMDATLQLSMMSMFSRGIGVKYIMEGDSEPHEFIPRLAALYRDGKFPFDRLIKKFPFASINEAAHAAETGDAVKPVLVF